MADLPYSYHTFLFPFVWNENGKVKREDFSKILSEKYWHKVGVEGIKSSVITEKNREKYRMDYALYQYLTMPAREILFSKNEKDSAVTCFEFGNDSTALKEEERYIIVKGQETFNLRLNGIRLNLFDAGIAILSFETEYYGYKGWDGKEKSEFSLDDINKINEYGRRIALPYIGTDKEPCALTADKISIKLQDSDTFCSQFLAAESAFCDCGRPPSLTYIPAFIKGILSLGSEFKVVSEKKDKQDEKSFYIYPAADDRMFVCCLVANEELSRKIKGRKTGSYLAGWKRGNEAALCNKLYKLFYIENSLSCQNVKMKKEIFENSAYQRWSDWGTLYGVTHHSFVCVTAPGAPIVINSFLTQYVHLAMLALAQRATILLLSARAAEVAIGLRTENRVMTDSHRIKDIEELQESYSRAQSQILFREVTVQEQGVELFELLLKQLYIKENKEGLDGQMDNLGEMASIINHQMEHKADEDLNRNMEQLSIIAVLLAIYQCVLFIISENTSDGSKVPAYVIATIGFIVLVCVCKLHGRKRDKTRN